VEDYVRVDPTLFGLPTREAVNEQLIKTYVDYYSKELGHVISVVEVLEIGEGVISQEMGPLTINQLLSY